MKKLFLLASAGLVSVSFLANLDGALPENTNAPGELTCGRAPCHNIPVNVGAAQISIVFADGDSTYLSDSTYQLQVSIQNPTTMRNGFQIVALNAFNQNMGAWQLTAPDKMKIIPGISFPNRKYVTHRAAGNLQNEWTVNWKAPAGSAGKVTFYACVLSANNNGMNTGDQVYSTKISVNHAVPLAAGEAIDTDYKVYPVLATTGVWVELPPVAEDFVFSLCNSGQALAMQRNESYGGLHFIETAGFPRGVYFLEIESGARRVVKKIVVR